MRDLHTHSTYSDGKASPEEVILAAIQKGLSEIGLSDHSYTFFDESYCMKKDRIASYKAELAALKKKYAGQISVLCGVEQDAYSLESTAGFDYAIGSAHYLKVGDVFGERERISAGAEIADEHGGGVFECVAGGVGNRVVRCVLFLYNRRFILEMSLKDGIKPVIVPA